MTRVRDAAIAGAVEGWFAREARAFPWRTDLGRTDVGRTDVGSGARSGGEAAARNPYVALVVEFMAQQTQISRVVQRLGPFLARFPTIEALAGGAECDVLALWSGLGYYRRARLLHAAAKAVVARGSGFPTRAAELLELPGVGSYTAGALASIVFGERTPAVDGNVTRVLLRLDLPGVVDQSPEQGRAWSRDRAGELLRDAASAGAFNEGLMELGATVCLPAPRTPRCEACPLERWCRARGEGVEREVPRAKALKPRRDRHACVVVLEDRAGRVLVEQRGGTGMWARLWQAPTHESDAEPMSASDLARWIGVAAVEPMGAFVHATTHRLVRFRVYRGVHPGNGWIPVRGEWRARAQIVELALASPQRRILLGTGGTPGDMA